MKPHEANHKGVVEARGENVHACQDAALRKDSRMNTEAIQDLRERSNEISRVVTTMHPIVPKLGDPAAQGEILRALFELTKQVEVVKKHLLRIEKRDDSAAL